jgi:hypothetical protein
LSFSHVLIFMGAVWCLINLLISLLATVVMVACLNPASCSDLAIETANTWRPLFWWALPAFAAGTYYGFRTTWPTLKELFTRARRHTGTGSRSHPPAAHVPETPGSDKP